MHPLCHTSIPLTIYNNEMNSLLKGRVSINKERKNKNFSTSQVVTTTKWHHNILYLLDVWKITKKKSFFLLQTFENVARRKRETKFNDDNDVNVQSIVIAKN